MYTSQKAELEYKSNPEATARMRKPNNIIRWYNILHIHSIDGEAELLGRNTTE